MDIGMLIPSLEVLLPSKGSLSRREMLHLNEVVYKLGLGYPRLLGKMDIITIDLKACIEIKRDLDIYFRPLELLMLFPLFPEIFPQLDRMESI